MRRSSLPIAFLGALALAYAGTTVAGGVTPADAHACSSSWIGSCVQLDATFKKVGKCSRCFLHGDTLTRAGVYMDPQGTMLLFRGQLECGGTTAEPPKARISSSGVIDTHTHSRNSQTGWTGDNYVTGTLKHGTLKLRVWWKENHTSATDPRPCRSAIYQITARVPDAADAGDTAATTP